MKGPKGEKRPADAIANDDGCSDRTGEEEMYYKQPNKVKGGRAGGKARTEKQSSEEKKEIARKGAKVRFGQRISNA